MYESCLAVHTLQLTENGHSSNNFLNVQLVTKNGRIMRSGNGDAQYNNSQKGKKQQDTVRSNMCTMKTMYGLRIHAHYEQQRTNIMPCMHKYAHQ